jgi:hypothetical protein
MQAEIETLEHIEGGWLLRFRSSSWATWTATKEKLKVLIDYPERYWDEDALDGKGAWFIEEEALARIGHLFRNYTLCRWLAEEEERQQHAQEAARRAEARAKAQEAARKRAEEYARQEAAKQQADRTLTPTNYHEAFTLLRLPESSPPTRIKEAYHQLALKHHPDLGGAHLMMVALNRAYELALAYAKASPAA